MAKQKQGRPSKIDKDTMHSANVWFIIIIIILLFLLAFGTLSAMNPEVYNYIKASIANLFN